MTDWCFACGQLDGEGTLLDFQPEIPPAARDAGITLDYWQMFARRYRCPVCAEARLPTRELLDADLHREPYE